VSEPAGPAVVEALRSDVDRLVSAEPDVRADAYDSIHQMRVATRRIRSLLRSYRRVFDQAAVKAVRGELKWLAGILGVARDAEVMADRFEHLLDQLPTDLVVGPVVDRLVSAQRAAYTAAHADVLAALDSERYRDLRKRLDELLDGPPRRREGLLTKALAAENERLITDVDVAASAPDDEHIAALHDVRKSAKRLRYAAESAQPLGEHAANLGIEAKALQSLLGDHRDAVESQRVILDACAAAREAGEDTFTYGVLYQLEGDDAERALAQYEPALEALARVRETH
jgi:CHAD domain-containing protein